VATTGENQGVAPSPKSGYVQFNANMIQIKNPLNVNARGMTKSSSTRADVDSSSNSTMPTAYRTDHNFSIEQTFFDRLLTSKDEMSHCQNLALEHSLSERLAHDAQSHGDNQQHKKRHRIPARIKNCN
jgi:hypothetical protein